MVPRRSNEKFSSPEGASRPGRGGDQGLGMEGAEERERQENMVCTQRKGSKNSLVQPVFLYLVGVPTGLSANPHYGEQYPTQPPPFNRFSIWHKPLGDYESSHFKWLISAMLRTDGARPV